MAAIGRILNTTRRVLQQGSALNQARYMAIQFKAPVRDINFVLEDVLNVDKHYEKLGFTELTPELRHTVVDEIAKFSENVLSPLYVTGDEEGCVLDKKTGDVKTPKGFKEAYAEYAAGGWQGLSVATEYGGQGLPLSLGLIKAELVGTANWAWGMYPGLAIGAMNTLLLHASEEMKKTYLTKLTEGTWLGTMCLTEPHCGTDLGQVKTKAVKKEDGSYRLTGTKIFISCGEHDFTENIVHIVLARCEGAPAGTRGISLFLVPKYVVKPDGTLEKKKNLVCGGLEEKMGIHGSSTCVMNFDDSVAYIIGKENQGLHQMFTFMNTARIGTAIQGVGAGELAYQGAVAYAKERMSMRALSGTKHPDKAADPLIVHGDVRKMLLTARAFTEGARCMLYTTAMMSDKMLLAKTEKELKQVDDEMGFITPILKAFATEAGCEAASHCMQVFGGHGYIRQNNMEQIVRDARIGTLYEGTTGIQALDLLGRKIFVQQGKGYFTFMGEVLKYVKKQMIDNYKTSANKKETLQLLHYTLKWGYILGRIGFTARNNRDMISTSSVDFLYYSGYVTMGYYWLRMMNVASEKLKTAMGADKEFYKAKIETGQFYFDRLLPRALSHAAGAVAKIGRAHV